MLLYVGLASVAAIVGALACSIFADDDKPHRRAVRPPAVVSEQSQVRVEVVDSDFEPRNLVVRPGAEVTWEFTGSLPHTVTDPGGAFDTGTMGRGERYSMKFDAPGEYFYYCVLHHAMQGTLTVVDAGKGE
jgi:plastocyanin